MVRPQLLSLRQSRGSLLASGQITMRRVYVASWDHIVSMFFGVGAGNAIYHLPWMEDGWLEYWEQLDGVFIMPPSVTSWGAGRLDIFGLGTDGGIYYRIWDENKGG